MTRARLSLRTVNWNRIGALPGMFDSCNSPSHVLQSQPFRESFCT